MDIPIFIVVWLKPSYISEEVATNHLGGEGRPSVDRAMPIYGKTDQIMKQFECLSIFPRSIKDEEQ